jgi:adenylate cyclase
MSAIEAHVKTELIVSERLRAKMLSILFLTGALVFMLLTILFRADYELVFGEGIGKYRFAGLLFAIAAYEVILYSVIRFRGKKGRSLPEVVRYLNAFVEVSMPTLAMILLSDSITGVYTLISPFVALYFIFIILSILRLHFMLSLFTGTVAAVEYYILAMFVLVDHQSGSSDPILGTAAIYIARSMMLIGAGISAGVIARLIRDKISSGIRYFVEREDAIDLFGQQVSGPIADELLHKPQDAEGVEREVTVMFIDIRDFTPFADSHRPEEVVAYLNTVFSALIAIVDRHSGIVNQFLGDGIMTTFGAPVSNPSHAAQAVSAAREILVQMSSMIEKGVIPPTRLGIGVHSGLALTGNIGSEARKQYSVTGTTVILASRIEQENKRQGTSLLFSENTRKLAGIAPATLRSIGPIHLKGTSDPLHLYTSS